MNPQGRGVGSAALCTRARRALLASCCVSFPPCPSWWSTATRLSAIAPRQRRCRIAYSLCIFSSPQNAAGDESEVLSVNFTFANFSRSEPQQRRSGAYLALFGHFIQPARPQTRSGSPSWASVPLGVPLGAKAVLDVRDAGRPVAPEALSGDSGHRCGRVQQAGRRFRAHPLRLHGVRREDRAERHRQPPSSPRWCFQREGGRRRSPGRGGAFLAAPLRHRARGRGDARAPQAQLVRVHRPGGRDCECGRAVLQDASRRVPSGDDARAAAVPEQPPGLPDVGHPHGSANQVRDPAAPRTGARLEWAHVTCVPQASSLESQKSVCLRPAASVRCPDVYTCTSAGSRLPTGSRGASFASTTARRRRCCSSVGQPRRPPTTSSGSTLSRRASLAPALPRTSSAHAAWPQMRPCVPRRCCRHQASHFPPLLATSPASPQGANDFIVFAKHKLTQAEALERALRLTYVRSSTLPLHAHPQPAHTHTPRCGATLQRRRAACVCPRSPYTRNGVAVPSALLLP